MRKGICQIVALLGLFFALPQFTAAQVPGEYESAAAFFREGEYAQAAELFRKADTVSPGTTDALVFAAKALVHLEKFAEADAALREYLAKHGASAEALYLLGYILHRENRPADSLEVYTKAAAVQRPTGDDLKIVGLDYVLLDDYTNAIHWLEKAVEFDAQDEEAWYFLGRAYYTRSRISDAKLAFTKALRLNPRDSKAENNLGLVFESEARPAQAIEAYKLAIAWQQTSAKPSEQPYLNLGGLLLDEGRTEEALTPLEQAAKLAGSDSLCRFKLGIAYLRLSRLDRARVQLEEAEGLDPENAAVHFELGKLYKQMKLMDQAQKEFHRAEEIQARAAAATPAKPNP